MGDMDLLVLGGTHHVGRAVVEVGARPRRPGHHADQGRQRAVRGGRRELHADRTDPAQLRAALGDGTWDAVIDTWSGAPRVVLDSARLLAGRAGHYGYVSSRSVYQWPIAVGADEDAPVVDGDPESDASDDYAAAKRGGELAAIEAFGDRAVLARAGLILGPYEGVGRMPWWLRRIERGGDVLAPGPPDMPLQYIDCRDLAAWMLTAADRGIGGAFSTRSASPAMPPCAACWKRRSPPPARTPGWSGCRRRSSRRPGIEALDRPAGLGAAGGRGGRPAHRRRVRKVYATGLTCRPVTETVADTWAWLQAEGDPPVGRIAHGLDPDREREVLASLAAPDRVTGSSRPAGSRYLISTALEGASWSPVPG